MSLSTFILEVGAFTAIQRKKPKKLEASGADFDAFRLICLHASGELQSAEADNDAHGETMRAADSKAVRAECQSGCPILRC
jgi:hypothetical protein